MTLSWLRGVDDGKVLYSTVFEAIAQAINQRYVKSGCSVSADGTGLTVTISSGVLVYDGTEYNYAGGSVTLDAGELDRDRADVIVWDYNGGSPTISVLQGSRWLNIDGSLKPMSERISDTQIPLAVVIVRAGATVVSSSDVLDVRVSAAVVKLSQLIVDSNLDMQNYDILNVGNLFVGGNATVLGDLTVSGATTTVDSQNLVVQDNEITLNNGEAGAGVTLDIAGIRIDRGTEIDAKLIWDETTDKWKVGIEGSEEDIILRTEFDTHTHTRSEVTDFFSSPFWANIPDKPSTFPSKLSQLTIDVDKDWGGRSIIGLYNVSLSGELTHAGTRTEIIGFDAAGFHWVRGVSGSDNDLFMGFRRKGAGDIAIYFGAPIFPRGDNRHSLGSSSFRWANIYGVNVYAGDLCFEEKECAVCGQPFEVDDEIVLKAYKIDKYTRTVPVHLKCSQAYKELDERLKLLEEKVGGD